MLSVWVSHAAEVTTLSPDNIQRLAPKGKEADAIVGDYVLHNDRIVAVIANPDLIMGANASRRGWGFATGSLIDLTEKSQQNDQLRTFFAGVYAKAERTPRKASGFRSEGKRHASPARRSKTGQRVTLPLVLPPRDDGLAVELRYTLRDGWSYVQVDVIYENRGDAPLTIRPRCALLSDNPEPISGVVDKQTLQWIYATAHGVAYGVKLTDSVLVRPPQGESQSALAAATYEVRKEGSDEPWVLPPGDQQRVRYLAIAGRDVFDVRRAMYERDRVELAPFELLVQRGNVPAAGALCRCLRDGELYGVGRTQDNGRLQMELPPGEYQFEVTADGGENGRVTAHTDAKTVKLELPAPGVLLGEVTDSRDAALPCKVTIRGRGQTPTPTLWGAGQGERQGNTILSADGTFEQRLPAGTYTVEITRGPEYERFRQDVELTSGATIELSPQLARVMATEGWISADFTTMTTRSGPDSTFACGVAVGRRVRTLMCEHIEFAPSADRNHATDFASAIARLGGEGYLSSAVGASLSWHRRAHAVGLLSGFPVPSIAHRQDGGMPQRPLHAASAPWLRQQLTGSSPCVILRVVPETRAQLLVDVDEDGHSDLANQPTFDAVDAVAITDLTALAQRLVTEPLMQIQSDWLTLLRLGHRMTGVASNTAVGTNDDHALRNYIRSGTDHPAELVVDEVAAAVRKGAVVMTTGPLINLSVHGDDAVAHVGGTLRRTANTAHLEIAVPVDVTLEHVRLLVVTAADSVAIDYDRQSHPGLFHAGVAQFHAHSRIAVARDAYVFAVAIGRELDGGRRHAAITNPVWVDVHGDGHELALARRPPVAVGASAGWLRQSRPIAARQQAKPGRFLLLMANQQNKEASGQLRLASWPTGAIQVLDTEVGEKSRSVRMLHGRETWPTTGGRKGMLYRLAAAQRQAVQYEIALAPNRSPGAVRIYSEPHTNHGRFAGLFAVTGYTLPLFVELAEKIDEARQKGWFFLDLSKEMPYTIHRGPAKLADLRLAATPSHLQLDAFIYDPVPRRGAGIEEGSALTIYTAVGQRPGVKYRLLPGQDKQPPITAFTLCPEVGVVPAAAYRQNGETVDGVLLETSSLGTAYRLRALVPYSELGLQAFTSESTFLMEVSVAAYSGATSADRIDATLFESSAPATDCRFYGRITMTPGRL